MNDDQKNLPAQLLADMAERRPGLFLLSAAALGVCAIGLIGYSICKDRKLKLDINGLNVTLD